ncbi:amidase [Peristeroidobacter soli]|uniref:amidase n=1 Tax=Peristeroidobacter soli TaxID=2497877 RepID=UPI00101D1EF8|nr:amidase [Peristeroidobacter soli]
MSVLPFMPLATAGSLIRQRRLSPVEYTQALIDHTAAVDGRLHAFLMQSPQQALSDARAAEAAIMAGQWRGSMHGIPYGLKDVIDYAGMPTTGNSAAIVNNIPDAHAAVTRRLIDAGSVMMGKLALHELSIGGPSFDLPWPVPINPWADDHFAGGSSSGCAVAVAAGMLPAAIGTDTGGSVRSPAANCGVVGMKPTRGLLSCNGIIPLAHSLDCVGVLTRTVRDNALVLQSLTATNAKARTNYIETLDRGVVGLRIGLIRHFYAGDETAHPEQVTALDQAATLLEKLGAEIVEIRLPRREEFSACCALILFSEAYAIFRGLLTQRFAQLGEHARTSIMSGATVSAADYIDAQRWRARLTRATNAAFDGLHAAITATNLDPAYPLSDSAAKTRALARHCRHPFSVTGHPAIAVPAGFSSAGLPLSLQIVGNYFDERGVYRIANAYQRATDWTSRRPANLRAA